MDVMEMIVNLLLTGTGNGLVGVGTFYHSYLNTTLHRTQFYGIRLSSY